MPGVKGKSGGARPGAGTKAHSEMLAGDKKLPVTMYIETKHIERKGKQAIKSKVYTKSKDVHSAGRDAIRKQAEDLLKKEFSAE